MLAAGHLSNLDPWALGLAIWPRRFLRFMAKSELFWFPLGPLIAACGAFKVRRGPGRRRGDRDRSRAAREGHVIAMFPEGTRRQEGPAQDARRRSAHTGAARIALDAGVPLVPAGIAARTACARLQAWRVRYGPPIAGRRPRATLPPAEAARIATERVMAAIAELEAVA